MCSPRCAGHATPAAPSTTTARPCRPLNKPLTPAGRHRCPNGVRCSCRARHARQRSTTLACAGQDKETPAATTRSQPGPRNSKEFVSFFRDAVPYIQWHTKQTFVIVLTGEVAAKPDVLQGVAEDLGVLHALGVSVVIVISVQTLAEKLLAEGECPSAVRYVGTNPVTDSALLDRVREAAGMLRFQVEGALSSGPPIVRMRRHGTHRDRYTPVRTVSGNFLACKRKGVVQGVDLQCTGEVRWVDLHAINSQLALGNVVVVNNLGFGFSGELLNCSAIDVGVSTAMALKAEKLIFVVDEESSCVLSTDGTCRRLPAYLPLQAVQLFLSDVGADYLDLALDPKRLDVNGQVIWNGASAVDTEQALPSSPGRNSTNTIEDVMDYDKKYFEKLSNKLKDVVCMHGGRHEDENGFCRPRDESRKLVHVLQAAAQAVTSGINRVHLVNGQEEGALLQELYTRDGVGTLVSAEDYDAIRPMNENDVDGVMALLAPLEAAGIVVPRPREKLTADLKYFGVIERDRLIVACAALIPYEGSAAEIGAIAVHPAYRNGGRGDRLLQHLERKARDMEVKTLFALTTRTADWFMARGFVKRTVSDLPQSKFKSLNEKRNSQIYTKDLSAH
mmetsp:Transcript_6879/g.25374  ORF Transcript_6879/g.25374 Transcript_6879/m.25374 type:complete len:617 (-) Transcript_6879:577-2427(-)